MKDKELIDMLLRLEARITQLEVHFHEYEDAYGQYGLKQGTRKTSNPKVRGSKVN